jgi:tetratricopeptide (TPR) repeat protein
MAAEKFNLNYKYGANLKPIMEDKESVKAYISFLQDRLQKIKPGQDAADKITVKLLGEIGTYAKNVGKLDLALSSLEKSLDIINDKNLGIGLWAANTLRYGDALRFKNDFLGAETAFRSVLEMIDRHPQIADYEDFAWQHLGKLKYDEGDLKSALEFLEKAKVIREKKGIKELLDSTNQALRVLQMKANNKRKY